MTVSLLTELLASPLVIVAGGSGNTVYCSSRLSTFSFDAARSNLQVTISIVLTKCVYTCACCAVYVCLCDVCHPNTQEITLYRPTPDIDLDVSH